MSIYNEIEIIDDFFERAKMPGVAE